MARSVEEPLLFAENNIINSVRLLEAMHRAGVGKFVFSSSATVYGTPKSLPIRETDPLGAQSNPYGASKVATEAFVATYNQLYGMDGMDVLIGADGLRSARSSRPQRSAHGTSPSASRGEA